ncbi:MAG: DUF2953 domain-containing protein [Pseudomonadota bacterium]
MTIVAVIGLVLLTLLVVPIGFRWEAAWPGDQTRVVSVRWLFGLARFEFDLAEPSADEAQTRTESKSDASDGMTILRIIRNRAARRRLRRFVDKLWRSLHATDLYARLRFGFDDPADTGVWLGYVSPLAVALVAIPVADIRVQPDFSGETFEFATRGAIHIVPLVILWQCGALLLSPTIWRAARQN